MLSEIFELEASPVEAQSLLKKKIREGKKEKRKYNKKERKASQNFNFCACASKNVLKHIASEKKACRHVANAFF